jgi:hypothetical protein
MTVSIMTLPRLSRRLSRAMTRASYDASKWARGRSAGIRTWEKNRATRITRRCAMAMTMAEMDMDAQAEEQEALDAAKAEQEALWQAEQDALEAAEERESQRFAAADEEYRSKHPACPWPWSAPEATEWAREVASRFDLKEYAPYDAEDWHDSCYGKAHWSDAHRDRDLARYLLE